VTVGGIEQWVTIRGEDRNNPVLLLLHGGPGDATNPWGYAVFRSWLRQFTVVQWDQRGAAKTLGRNGPSIAPTITVDRMVQDGIELTQQLRAELRQNKIILVGHSFGSLLGVKMAQARPDLFYAFVGTGQVAADQDRAIVVAYHALLAAMKLENNDRAVRELEAVGVPPWKDGRGYGVVHRWANLSEHADLFLGSMMGLALGSPDYSVRDIDDWFDGQGLSGDRLIGTPAMNPSSMGRDFAIPVFVFQGAEDFTTPTSLAKAWVDSIRAPKKTFVAIEGAGHFAAFMKADEFLRELVARVRPLAAAR
jgi:pimeloyl-ACP methyl ester carboxylesterase